MFVNLHHWILDVGYWMLSCRKLDTLCLTSMELGVLVHSVFSENKKERRKPHSFGSTNIFCILPDMDWKDATEELSKPVQPPSTKAGRDEISRSGEPLTPIWTRIDISGIEPGPRCSKKHTESNTNGPSTARHELILGQNGAETLQEAL